MTLRKSKGKANQNRSIPEQSEEASPTGLKNPNPEQTQDGPSKPRARKKPKMTTEEVFKLIQDTIKSEHTETRNTVKELSVKTNAILESLIEQLEKNHQ